MTSGLDKDEGQKAFVTLTKCDFCYQLSGSVAVSLFLQFPYKSVHPICGIQSLHSEFDFDIAKCVIFRGF